MSPVSAPCRTFELDRHKHCWAKQITLFQIVTLASSNLDDATDAHATTLTALCENPRYIPPNIQRPSLSNSGQHDFIVKILGTCTYARCKDTKIQNSKYSNIKTPKHRKTKKKNVLTQINEIQYKVAKKGRYNNTQNKYKNTIQITSRVPNYRVQKYKIPSYQNSNIITHIS